MGATTVWTKYSVSCNLTWSDHFEKCCPNRGCRHCTFLSFVNWLRNGKSIKLKVTKNLNHLNLNNYFNFHVFLSIQSSIRPCVCQNQLYFLHLHNKMLQIKVAWYVLRVKNIHSGSSLDPWVPLGKMKLSYLHYKIKQISVSPPPQSVP